MTPTRYDKEDSQEGYPSSMVEHPQGDWVEWDEYEELLEKYKNLAERITDIWRDI